MKPTLFIVGTGPGDPDLLTLKAYKNLQSATVIVAPKASKKGTSTALSIAQQAVDLSGKEIVEVHFPMKKVRLGESPKPELSSAWVETAETILKILDSGTNVTFPTLGDPAIYSTGYYLYATLLELRPDLNVEFISGISAMSGCSASTHTPVCLGDDTLVVVPAAFSEEKIRQAIEQFDAIVLMKVYNVMDQICRILKETGLTQNAIYVEKAGMDDQRIVTDLSSPPENPHYFSTIIIRKNVTASINRSYQAAA